MSIFKVLRGLLSRKKRSAELTDSQLSTAIHRDLGVRVERIRLPSGGEVVIVERVADDAFAITEERADDAEEMGEAQVPVNVQP